MRGRLAGGRTLPAFSCTPPALCCCHRHTHVSVHARRYILVYPQGCDVCNHLSLFLCVADYDKLLPGGGGRGGGGHGGQPKAQLQGAAAPTAAGAEPSCQGVAGPGVGGARRGGGGLCGDALALRVLGWCCGEHGPK